MENPRYSVRQVGFIGKLFHHCAANMAKHVPTFLTANLVTSIGMLGSVAVLTLLASRNRFAGIAILVVMSLDFLDGAIARHRKQSSEFGGVWDGIGDVLFLFSVFVGLYFYGQQILALGLVLAYGLDSALRRLLGHSTSLLGGGSERYKRANATTGLFPRLTSGVTLFMNYFDSLAVLAVVTTLAPKWVVFWMVYELARRVLVVLKKFREVFYIYQESSKCMPRN